MKKILFLLLTTTTIGLSAMDLDHGYNWKRLRGIEIKNEMRNPISYMVEDEKNITIQSGETAALTVPIDIARLIQIRTKKGLYFISSFPEETFSGCWRGAIFTILLNNNPVMMGRPSHMCSPFYLFVNPNGELQIDMQPTIKCPPLRY